MKRVITPYLKEYWNKKIILITGPRQTGKSTLAQMLSSSIDYLNFDNEEHRQIIREQSWDRAKELIVLDEIHKSKNWKRWLKGVFDTEGIPPRLLVTGSAKLDTYKKTGDSLAGRYFQYRLHPIDLREIYSLSPKINLDDELVRLLNFGGFPEPYLEQNSKFYNLWKKTHLDIILRQDLISQEDVKDIMSIELLVDLLKTRVASPLSYLSLAQDLQSSDKTIKRWLTLLENMYVVFKITPFHKNIARSKLKQPKYYFYDLPRATDMGARLENLVACSLLKECHFREDCLGEEWNLHYLAKKDGHEIDFILTKNNKPHIIIEVKTSEDTPSKNFSTFSKDLPKDIIKIQLVQNLKKEKTYSDKTEVRKLSTWLARMPF